MMQFSSRPPPTLLTPALLQTRFYNVYRRMNMLGGLEGLKVCLSSFHDSLTRHVGKTRGVLSRNLFNPLNLGNRTEARFV
jgi:hypothetical protein